MWQGWRWRGVGTQDCEGAEGKVPQQLVFLPLSKWPLEPKVRVGREASSLGLAIPGEPQSGQGTGSQPKPRTGGGAAGSLGGLLVHFHPLHQIPFK